MNKTVELVNLWGAFEEKHPEATLEDFFRHSLASRPKSEPRPEPGGKLIPNLDGKLIILLRRIGKFHIAYSNMGLAATELSQMEEFGILVTIYNEGNPIKSEAIFNNIMELSSGSNMLMRMKKKGLVTEYADPGDKRVKRLKVTPKGEQTLMAAKDIVLKVAEMMVHDLCDEDKRLCIQLLKPIDRRFSGMYQKQKNKSFEDIYKENMQK
ncbi:MarR family winged helix-turn-helix transcriptional regulator [Mucilaginibacter sp. L3T2-6]|uniref:MarR family winged helix-turn-helix transcriptional regulator n=1 Tax=Mucilaginibacter sp. L3T2-6 TaxID=3062491 RepID=UPI0026763DD0|nr:winged helix DNA-binding protein [Mucilaginibacter sp. L3T2-6]MDO3642808.1 winged helix DNA-binding protein [Mucilaginibacter sp. L3T2-6]MDV6215457.1 winged helix DNA-binding protein [Mucilaginibacter sp. L3T2-6]